MYEDDFDSICHENDIFADHLISNGHKCVRILESYPTQVAWCEQTTCKHNTISHEPRNSRKEFDELKQQSIPKYFNKEINGEQDERDVIDRQRMNFANQLRNEGHKCIEILESNPCQIRWCGNTNCLLSKNKYNNQYNEDEEYKLYHILLSKGHRCVKILESYPIQVEWCGQEMCKHPYVRQVPVYNFKPRVVDDDDEDEDEDEDWV